MKLDINNIKKLSDAKGLSLSKLLKSAKVSRTAYYSLSRKESLLPNSVHAIAKALGTSTTKILEESNPQIAHIRILQKKLERILEKRPKITSRENAWHTMLLLEEEPIERLRRALLRGRGGNIHYQE